MTDELSPPRAPARPTVLRAHDDERVDPWFWLCERDNPEVLDYLRAENAYTEAALAPTAALRDTLFEEIVGRVQETDVSPPVRRGPWEYFTRTIEGMQYDVHCRRPAGTPGLPDPFAPPGHRGRRADRARRERARRRPRLLRGRRPHREHRSLTGRVHHRRHRR